jgi:hypothetical protein
MSTTRALLLLTGLLVAFGCSNARRLANGKPLKNQGPNAILTQYEATAMQWEWLAMKVDAEVTSTERDGSFSATIRMARDSVIWVSISPALGVEVARLKLTPDSVFLISKVPNNKFHYAGDYGAIAAWLNTPIGFSDLQDVLIGRPMGLDPENDKFISRIDGREYVLISKYKRRTKRVVGLDDKEINPDDSLSIALNPRAYERLRERTDEDDLLIKRHWFDGLSFDPVRDVFDDLYYQRFVTVSRSDFNTTDGGRLPGMIDVLIESPEGVFEVRLDVGRTRLNKAYDFPFEVPEDMEFRDAF